MPVHLVDSSAQPQVCCQLLFAKRTGRQLLDPSLSPCSYWCMPERLLELQPQTIRRAPLSAVLSIHRQHAAYSHLLS